ncbi:MAG: hypothetical protein LBS07_05050, partial [Prevotellaceae bacterium]|nr:hypothetical protein [Prevotellaceae bacterium]
MKSLVFILFPISLLVSCGGDSSTKDVENRLLKIEGLIEENAYSLAKLEIDSIHALYPRLVDKRRKAQTFMDTIVRRESARTIAYCDSVLLLKKEKVKVLEHEFKFEKNEKYQRTGSFVHRALLTETNAGRIFLKAYIDELAGFYITSFYSGSKIAHTRVAVSCGNSFAETAVVAISNSSNYNFTDNGQRWEMVTFKDEEALPIAEFITYYADKQLKVTLRGDRDYSYFLSNQDKKALTGSYNFWIEKKDIAL